MEFVKNLVTDSDTIEFLTDIVPDRTFIYNKTNKTIYEKNNKQYVPIGSEEAYRKGEKALHYEGEVSKVSELNNNATIGSVFLVENDTQAYSGRVVNSLFIKLPSGEYQEVRLNTYSTMEVDKFVQDEADARESADNTLQDNIDAEESAREDADTTLQNNIDSEARTRADADSTLQNNLNDETDARESADETLQNNLNDEISAREGADSTLQDNIDSEAETRESEDNDIKDSISALDDRVSQNEEDIASTNDLLSDNIDFENNKVVQFGGELQQPPSNFSNYKVGTTWKITEDFTLNDEEYPAGTFIFKKDENGLDIFTGAGNSKYGVFEEARIVSDAGPTWVGNYYLGNTGTKGKYILFNRYVANAQSYSFGHFLLKGPSSVYDFDVLINQVNGTVNNFSSSGAGPCTVYTCTYNNRAYYALYIDTNEQIDVFYTGWLSDNFESLDYVQADLSNFSRIALGELDLDNLPKGSSVEWEPIWRYSDGSRNSIVEYWENWDFERYPICYLKPVLANNGNSRSLDCRYIFGNDANNWYNENLSALRTVLGDITRPTYLIMNEMVNMNRVSAERLGMFFGGVANEFPGLVGLIMPQDAGSNYCGVDALNNNNNRYFLCNFQNLKAIKLNPYTTRLGTFSIRDLPSLESLTLPDSLASLDFNENRPLEGCTSLTSMYLPSYTNELTFEGTYGAVIQAFWARENSAIYVISNLLSSYKNHNRLNGYLHGIFRSY